MNHKSKILFVHHGVGVGGALVSLCQMISNLDKNLFDYNLVVMQSSDSLKMFDERGIKVDEILEVEPFSHTVIWWYSIIRIHRFIKAFFGIFLTLFFAFKILKKYKPDVVHLNSSPLWPWLFATKFLGIKSICHVRESLNDGYFGVRKFLITQIINKYSDKILAISRHDGRFWQGSEKLEILYNAVDEVKFSNQDEPLIEDSMSFIYVGGVSVEKGIIFLLKIWSKLPFKEGLVLRILGYWPKTRPSALSFVLSQSRLLKKCEALISQSANRVEVVGQVFNPELYMKKSDVLLFPCTTGHFARPVIEAGFLSKTSFVSSLSPLEEIVDDNKTGFLLPLDEKAWLKKIKFILLNKGLLDAMGKNAFLTYQEKFNLEKQTNILKKIYLSMS